MQVPPEARECVFFVCYKRGDDLRLAGTAFMVSVSAGANVYGYVVTAKHVIAGIRQKSSDGKVYLRANNAGAGAMLHPAPMDQWVFHPEDPLLDVAVLPGAPPPGVEFKTIPETMVATPAVLDGEEIGLGDEVFITGLFVSHHGRERNTPIVRVGNIALMPGEPVQTQYGRMEAYLIEARSIGGLSGSPVFVHLGPIRASRKQNANVMMGDRFYWLGLVHGHWDAPVAGSHMALEDDLPSGERVNVGIAIVIPAYKVMEVINQPFLVDAREKLEKQQTEQGA